MAKKTFKSKVQKPYRHGDLRTTLLRAAVNYLKSGSASELSLRELARQAGVSEAAPYRHFRDKADLVAAVAAEGYRYLADGLIKVALDRNPDPADQFFQQALVYFRFGENYSEHFRLMHGPFLSKCRFELYPALYLQSQRAFYSVVKVLLNCRTQGLLGTTSLSTRAMYSIVAVHGFTDMYLNKRLHWLGVDAQSADSALQGYVSNLLKGMQHIGENVTPFTVLTKPVPILVFQELGLTASDVLPDAVELFEINVPSQSAFDT